MKLLWIFLLLLAAVIAASFLGNMVENFAVASDTSGNTTDYITHSQAGGTSTFSSTTDPTTGATTYDNYNHYDGATTGTGQLINGAVYYGPNGGRATVVTGPNGGMAIRITFPNDPTPIVYNSVSVNTWQGPNGTATLAQSSDGTAALKVTLNNGTTYVYTINPASSGGSTGTSTGSASDTANYDTTYYASTGSPPPQSSYYAYDQPPPPPAPVSTQPPPPLGAADGGIPRSMIPPGQEDLYVLKSSIVPPVCPACPPVIAGPGTCPAPPPCPPCARCPEPQFDCKKVPNYSAVNNTSLPLPVLNSFAGFGL